MTSVDESIGKDPMKGDISKSTIITGKQSEDYELKKSRHILKHHKKSSGILATLFTYIYAVPLRFLTIIGLWTNTPTLQLTGSLLVDKSPARPFSEVPPKRKHWEEDTEDEGCPLAVLEDEVMDYDSQEDDDYNPDQDHESDTPDEEYAEDDVSEEEDGLKAIDNDNIISEGRASRRVDPTEPIKAKKGDDVTDQLRNTPDGNASSKSDSNHAPNVPVQSVSEETNAQNHAHDGDVEEIGQDVLIIDVNDIVPN